MHCAKAGKKAAGVTDKQGCFGLISGELSGFDARAFTWLSFSPLAGWLQLCHGAHAFRKVWLECCSAATKLTLRGDFLCATAPRLVQ
jgi:hypothetical protein